MTVTPEAASMLSRLTLIHLDDLVPHESVEQGRLYAVAHTLTCSGVLKNPVLVTRLPDGKWLVIDGAHRTGALRLIGSTLALAQVVEPEQCLISSWHHLVRASPTEIGMDDLLVDRCPSCHSREAEPAGTCVARVHLLGRMSHAWCDAADASSAARMARDLAARYVTAWQFSRSLPDDRQASAPEQAASLRIAYRPWSIEQLHRLAACGLTLPAGITRFVVPGRVLGVDVPLSLLAGNRAAVSAPAAVRRHVEKRRFRYYAEPVFLAE
jgi:hypothetical protein